MLGLHVAGELDEGAVAAGADAALDALAGLRELSLGGGMRLALGVVLVTFGPQRGLQALSAFALLLDRALTGRDPGVAQRTVDADGILAVLVLPPLEVAQFCWYGVADAAPAVSMTRLPV